jgi:prepilin-type N-terminal cleavage/methylation domain-containing protein
MDIRITVNRVAFTLIELLIVVAIIAILAAIAVPNFLLAQTRAKVSRCKADQRTVVTALEAYAADTGNNRYPEYNNPRDSTSVLFLPVTLTTPVAYVTGLPLDVFPGSRAGITGDGPTTYFYRHNYDSVYLGVTRPAGHVQEHYNSMTGSNAPAMYTFWSYGPDMDDDHGVTLYDPTNGTISNGDQMKFGPAL